MKTIKINDTEYTCNVVDTLEDKKFIYPYRVDTKTKDIFFNKSLISISAINSCVLRALFVAFLLEDKTTRKMPYNLILRCVNVICNNLKEISQDASEILGYLSSSVYDNILL